MSHDHCDGVPEKQVADKAELDVVGGIVDANDVDGDSEMHYTVHMIMLW